MKTTSDLAHQLQPDASSNWQAVLPALSFGANGWCTIRRHPHSEQELVETGSIYLSPISYTAADIYVIDGVINVLCNGEGVSLEAGDFHSLRGSVRWQIEAAEWAKFLIAR